MKKFIFDLDNTLYPQSINLFPLIDERINRYMVEKVGIPEKHVDGLRRHYWKEYGVTLNGLMVHYQVDPEDYLGYVHDVDLKNILKPNQKLRKALESIDCPMVIFTNGSSGHAQNVLSALGLSDIFQNIFDVRIASFKPKPFPEPYIKVLERIQAQAEDCVMVDDLPENLRTAKTLGMKTVLIGPNNGHDYIDLSIEKACEIAGAAEIME